MKFKKNLNNNYSENNVFWVTMTDLMTGLVLVFIVMFFYAYLTGHVQQMQQDVAKENASKVLQESLKDKNIEAVVDSTSGIVKISDLELFDLNSYTISPKGKIYLASFIPAYFDSIFTNEYLSENVDKIVIQGHTDSQIFHGQYSQSEQYMKNMELSLKRALAVANYMINTNYNKANSSRLKKMIVVEGVSSSNPVIINGKEDFSKSRRVELKLVMKNEKRL